MSPRGDAFELTVNEESDMTRKIYDPDNPLSLVTNRRNFLIKTGTGVVGCALLPFYEPLRIEAVPLNVSVKWGFLKALFRFAKKVGMAFLGFTLSNFLGGLEANIRQKLEENLSSLFGIGYGQKKGEAEVATGNTTMFVPLANNANLREGRLSKAAVVPFYDVGGNAESRVGSVLSTPTMSGLPDVAEDLERDGHSSKEIYNLLVPTKARQNSYNLESLPDTYITRAGAVEANYHPYDLSSGDLDVKVTRKRSGKSERLEPLIERTYGLNFA
jgi:hypothetical protein